MDEATVPGSNSLLEAFQTSAWPFVGAEVVMSTSDKSPTDTEPKSISTSLLEYHL